MKRAFPFGRIILGALCCLLVTMPGVANAKPKAKTTTAKTTESHDAVRQKLHSFAQEKLTSMNKHVIPSRAKKAVTQNADGTFTAKYIEIDLNTLSTNFAPPQSSSAVTYIGRMDYVEVEYYCTAKTKNEALKGPFISARRESMTELVKYKKGKWSY